MSGSTEDPSIPFARPWITEEDRSAAAEVLEGHILTHGPEGAAFEQEFSRILGDGANSVTVSSCMAALHLASIVLGHGPGDEVILPAQTHVAAAHAVEWTGATPVFVDCDERDGNISVPAVEAAITERTRAISVVHYAGIPCDMGSIMALARRHDLQVIEDAALALGARSEGTHVGLIGDVGCFSFYPTKHITTGEGGMIISRHPDLAARIARVRAFGVDRTYVERTRPGLYDVPMLGLNYRMSEMQAALGRSQLRRIDEILERRRANFERLSARLRGLKGVRVVDVTDSDRATNSHYVLTAVLDPDAPPRDAVAAQLNGEGIGTSVYYPQPVPRMTYYRERYGYDPARYPHAEGISDRSIALPVGPHVSSAGIDRIADRFAAAVAT